jgi:hypothetical protein
MEKDEIRAWAKAVREHGWKPIWEGYMIRSTDLGYNGFTSERLEWQIMRYNSRYYSIKGNGW